MSYAKYPMPEFFGNHNFCLSTDEDGRPCVREYMTTHMYTPGDSWGHSWDSERHQRYIAPLYECDACVAENARLSWLKEAKEACKYFGIQEEQ